MKLRPFEETLYRELKDPEFAAAYLEDALADSVEEFLIALRKYLQANGGVGKIAKAADLSREAVYRMLSEAGNPAFRSLDSLFRAAGLHFKIAVRGPLTGEENITVGPHEDAEREALHTGARSRPTRRR